MKAWIEFAEAPDEALRAAIAAPLLDFNQSLAGPSGQGLGAQLMRQAEAEAVSRGCQHACVDTKFGARGFYERLGYTVFGELADYVPGFTRSFLHKRLSAAGASE